MKILYISSADSLGGGERHLADLANGMVQRGHEVLVAVRTGSALAQELHRVPQKNIYRLSLRNALDATSARELARLVRSNQVQIVHAHMARDYPLAAFAVRNTQAKLVVTRHVLFALNRLHRLTLRKARVIAVSQAVASQLLAGHIVANERLTVIHNGIDVDHFIDARQQFDRQSFLDQWKLPGDTLLVGIVGELTPLKGQKEFLMAAAQVLERFPQTHFVVAGTDHSADQNNLATIEATIRELNLSQRVRQLPWIDHIAQLYCALDVFVSASFTESFGLAIAEAMACGTAVVSTSTGGAKEIIRDQETGLLVQVGDVDQLAAAISRLLADPKQRVEIGHRAQKDVAARFGRARMIDETEKLYRDEIER